MTSENNWRRLLIAAAVLLLSSRAGGSLTTAALSGSNERFALRLVTTLGLAQPRGNVAVSPLQLHAALSLLYAGLSPNTATAQQLRVALELQYLGSPAQAMLQFQQLLSQLKQEAAVGCQLRLLSELYAQQRFSFSFRNEFVSRAAALGIGVQRLDFDSWPRAAHAINYDFLTRSNYSVGEVVSGSLLSTTSAGDTPFLLVSALTFRAPWAQGFNPLQTQRINFFSEGQSPKLVDAMFIQHRFKYAELPELDARLVELPYATAQLSLLIVFPNQPQGLVQLERQLQRSEFHQLRRQLSEQKVALTLPKFSLLVHTELRSVLEQMGLSKLFTGEAHLENVFSSFLDSSAPHLTAVPHTALLELDEVGGEAGQTFVAAFTDLFRSTLSLVINHPFFYAIGNEESLLMAGHVVDI